MTEKNEFGDTKTIVKPFVIDLDSTNGTFVNDQEIPPSRYYELRARDSEFSPIHPVHRLDDADTKVNAGSLEIRSINKRIRFSTRGGC